MGCMFYETPWLTYPFFYCLKGFLFLLKIMHIWVTDNFLWVLTLFEVGIFSIFVSDADKGKAFVK